MKILLISGSLPWPLEPHGTAQRSGHLVRALRKWGEVDILVAADKTYFGRPETKEKMERPHGFNIRQVEVDFSQEAAPWRQLARLAPGKLGVLFAELGRSKASYTCTAATLDTLQHLVRDGGYDVVVTRYLRFAAMTGAAFLSTLPTLLDFDDIDWAVLRSREDSVPQGPVHKIRTGIVGWHMEHTARKCLAKFGHVWVTSMADQSKASVPRSTVLPNIPILPPAEASDSSAKSSTRAGILFVATLDYWPNASGLDRFLQNVWPPLLEACPDVVLRVVGRLPQDSPSLADWKKTPNVEFLGFVDDLDAYYASSLFSIAPIYWGGGTKIKVLESLGRGRTLVCTPHALYGVHEYIRHEDSVWCASTDESFVEGCVALLGDHELRSRLELRGKEVVRETFSVARFQEGVDSVLSQFATDACADET